eukprot:TRINITY_DN7505_c0_g1_i2.p1 TRINITY_DN7505_c0_g1~~TRINITY_DN7505_c0_g1_i2.p1  ORF type:complete len:315 (+),score=41.38 TRINITY_DN7505_c0_g1_i2:44-988(+)
MRYEEKWDEPGCVLVSYNILADKWTKKSSYARVAKNVMDWENRKERISAKMLEFDPDIFCLQELDPVAYSDHFEPVFSSNGYCGVMQTSSKKAGQPVKHPGLALFVKKSAYEITWTNSRSRIMIVELQRKNGAEILGNPKSNPFLYVLNAHLEGRHSAADIRVNQIKSAFEHLQKRWATFNAVEAQPATILCGDFNSHSKSGIFKLITDGMLPKDYADPSFFNKVIYTKTDVKLPFKMKSAFHSNNSNYTPRYSFRAPGLSAALIDFVFFANIELLAVWQVATPCELALIKKEGLPTKHNPSDHLPLRTVFLHT